MQISLTRFNSNMGIRATIEEFKSRFPLSKRLSDVNTILDIWADHEDNPESFRTIVELAAKSQVAIVVLHLSGISVNNILTNKGNQILEILNEHLTDYEYSYFGGTISKTIMWGMLHPGLVYME